MTVQCFDGDGKPAQAPVGTGLDAHPDAPAAVAAMSEAGTGGSAIFSLERVLACVDVAVCSSGSTFSNVCRDSSVAKCTAAPTCDQVNYRVLLKILVYVGFFAGDAHVHSQRHLR
jgi:hypothetical protein